MLWGIYPCTPPTKLKKRRRIYVKLKFNKYFFHHNIIGNINKCIKYERSFVLYLHTLLYGYWAASIARPTILDFSHFSSWHKLIWRCRAQSDFAQFYFYYDFVCFILSSRQYLKNQQELVLSSKL